ncbi:MAG: GAF domain-containing protein, partial [Serratia inhibens]|uniref:GAF domain-containing protein n=1 Tax=Serratia inhibens TaxID=2338073 RepID=UPI003C7CCECC
MSNASIEKQELLEITRLLFSQRDYGELLAQLQQIVRRRQLADDVALVLLHPNSARVSFHGQDGNGQPLNYQDETLLANGPIALLRENTQPLRLCGADLHRRYPQLEMLALYPPLSHYCLMPLRAGGQLLGGCELSRNDGKAFSDAALGSLATLMELTALAVEQVQLRETAERQQRQLRHERDDFRVLVDVTNAVLSKLDLDDLIGEISSEIHRFFKTDAISIVLPGDRDDRVTIYATHYLKDNVAKRQQYSVPLAGTLSERVMQSGEMLLLNLKHSDPLAEYE